MNYYHAVNYRVKVRVMVFNATFNNISVLSRRSVLLEEETGVAEKPPTCHKSLTNFAAIYNLI